MSEYNDRLERMDREKRERRAVNLSPKRLIVLALMVLVAVWALMNREDVRLSYIFGDVDAPLSLVMFATFVLGVVAGFILDSDKRS